MSNYLAAAPQPGGADAHSKSSVRRDVTVRRGVKALVASSERVLLVRERHADGRPFWTLPGGGVHPEERPMDALQRELVEELDCDAVPGETLTDFWYAHHGPEATLSVYDVVSCSITSPVQPVRDEGIFEARWVDPDRLPPRTLPQVRHLLCEHGP